MDAGAEAERVAEHLAGVLAGQAAFRVVKEGPLRNVISPQYAAHNTQYTIHNTQYTVRSTQYTVHSTQYTVHSTQRVHSVHSTQCTPGS